MKKLLAMLLALMMVLSILTVAVFAQSTDNVDDDEPGDITVTDNEPVKDDNPKTGIALAVVPMMVAAAAAAVSKKH